MLVRPPFLRPDVSDGQITVKIMDNGIQTELKRTKVRKVGGLARPRRAQGREPVCLREYRTE